MDQQQLVVIDSDGEVIILLRNENSSFAQSANEPKPPVNTPAPVCYCPNILVPNEACTYYVQSNWQGF
ncbi:uncharacterized protein N7483_010651 [Penicillium malachiteum]|uniref:uncharacterized protein n=1 Tax=Penicillium malachiteum TaxID=1324776 RepID=UPI0025495FDC|nr:uncharacterized protein N7483_010651 [Penicillium malachiteum]KAJ5713470.1 hypothetical protein N7483_010651 [Penicillium malachiteum]